jgi:ABC-type polysaccharide/polyol phosphate transport system ATPase subunit
MSLPAISVNGVSKYFRLYHEKNQYLKTALLRGRRANYEEFWAVKDVTFEIPTGTTYGIIGSNGSGKSTLLKCLAGILFPDKGSITHNGKVVALLELGAGFHPDLSGRENIYLNGAILGMSQAEIEEKFDEIVDFSGLENFIDTPVKNYSSGMVVRLGFAIAINVDPEILIIDEVLAVGDASFQLRCLEKIDAFRKLGKTVVLVSHGLDQVVKLCSTVIWLDKGRVKMIGPANEVVNEYSGMSYGAEETDEGEIGKRWGSHEIEITKVELLDETGVEPKVLVTGKPLTVRIHYSAHTPLDDVIAGIRITLPLGTNVWGSNSKRRGVAFPRLFGEGYIDLQIPSLPLLEGSYDLTLNLADVGEIHEYDHWDRRIRFDVVQDNIFDEGTLTITSTWQQPSHSPLRS